MVTLSLPAPTLSQSTRGTGTPPASQGTRSQQLPVISVDPTITAIDTPTRLNATQKRRIVKANFERTKNDAAELAAIAKELREEMNKPNADVLSVEVVNRAEKIEKLAKKIREETKGY
jgi:hypothetical protein